MTDSGGILTLLECVQRRGGAAQDGWWCEDKDNEARGKRRRRSICLLQANRTNDGFIVKTIKRWRDKSSRKRRIWGQCLWGERDFTSVDWLKWLLGKVRAWDDWWDEAELTSRPLFNPPPPELLRYTCRSSFSLFAPRLKCWYGHPKKGSFQKS